MATCVATLATSVTVLAQSATAPATTPSEQVVRMSAFEVMTTQGHGYVATNADAGFKTTQKLLDIPQDIQVVTRDMIDDIGAADSSVVLQYFGSGQGSFMGEATAMRGLGSKYPYVDDQPENQSYEDNFFVDSYVVVRGDAQVLYLNAAPTGINLKYTKKPLPFKQTLLQASIDGWGGTRALLDTTGPLGSHGDMKFGYRFVAVQQGPSYYFHNIHESHEGLFPVLQMDVGHTAVRFSSVFLKIMHIPGGMGIIQPDGNLYVGAGPRNVFVPPNDMEQHEEHRHHIDISNKASDNWTFRFAASYWHYHRFNPIIENNTYNWANQTINYFARLNDITIDYWTMLGDISGKYEIGPLAQQDNLGFGYTDQLVHQYLPASPVFSGSSYPAIANPNVNVPMASAAAVNALVVPSESQFPPLANMGLHNQSYVTDIYWQHQTDIIPRYLTGVVGWTWATVVSDNTPNVSTVPYIATVVPASQWIHRFGLVAHPIKQVAIYAMTATGFAPPSGATPILYNGTQAPPQSYQGNEVGFKTDIMDGKISTTFAVFKITQSNLLTVGPGYNPQGSGYYIPIGLGVGEGWDGDIALYLTSNWQLIAYAYSGKWLDQNKRPLPSSYDNSYSIFTRYQFRQDSALHGLAIGGGVKQTGGGHVNTSNIQGYTGFAPVPAGSTQTFKIHKGFDLSGFVTYPITKHINGRLAISNITDEHYPIGLQNAILADASPPRTVKFQLDFKY